ncbi:hypothetical protein [Arthrobacter sp.]
MEKGKAWDRAAEPAAITAEADPLGILPILAGSHGAFGVVVFEDTQVLP